MYTSCSSYLTLTYFLRLLQSEYQRDIASVSVKRALRLLFEQPTFLQHSLRSNIALTSVMQRLQNINQVMASEDRGTMRHYVREMCQNIEGRPGKVTQEQIDMMASVENKMVTNAEACPVYLN